MEPIWSVSERVVATQLGDGLALLNLETNEYFSLNDVGAFVWSEIQSARSRDAIIRAVVEKYDVSEEACACDVDLLFEELRNASLVRPHLDPAR